MNSAKLKQINTLFNKAFELSLRLSIGADDVINLFMYLRISYLDFKDTF